MVIIENIARARRYLKVKIRKLLELDDYNWKKYTQRYNAQISNMEETTGVHGSDFIATKFTKTTDNIIFHDNLHGNWREIYTSILKCKPKTVFECGCGGMYHLQNIQNIFSEIEVYGCDLLQSQITFGKTKFNIDERILKNVKVTDFTKSNATDKLGKYDFVFSHAVMMHLSHRKALQFLKNMTSIAKKNIFFIEGSRHNYIQLLRELGELKKFNVEMPKQYVDHAILLHRK